MASGNLQPKNKIIYFITLFLILGTFVSCEREANAPSGEFKVFNIPENLSNGDLVFRKGTDLISRCVLSQGESPRFSHVGVIVLSGSGVFVVHSLPGGTKSVNGVQMEPLSSFISSENASEVAFYRAVGVNKRSRADIRKYLLKQIGKPFDEKFQLSDDSRMYCSELVVKAFRNAGMNIFEKLPTIKVMLVDEPVLPPGYLCRSYHLRVIN